MKSLIALTWSLIVFLISSPGPVFWPALVVTSTIAAMMAARIATTRIRPITRRTRLPLEAFAAAGAGAGAARGLGAGARRAGGVAGSSRGRYRVASVRVPVIALVAASLSGGS